MGSAKFPDDGETGGSIIYTIIAIICAFYWVPKLGWFLGILKSIFWIFILLWNIIVWLLN